MAIDLNDSYEQTQSRLQSSKTFLESKTSIKNAIKKGENQNTPSFNGSTFKLSQAELEK